MTYEELFYTYRKVRRVIRSCKTVAQLNSSRRYALLFMKLVPPNNAELMADNLTRCFKKQKRLLWL